MMSVARALLIAILGHALAPGASAAEPAPPLVDTICPLMEKEAAARGLPPMYFVRLIWRESGFRINVVSHKGAQGIAQFMPGTAKERGLADPFDPVAAISHSAFLLADLQQAFGNFGLAAAAYNAGPERVRAWLAGQRTLPAETRAYVQFITGHPAEAWKEPQSAPQLPEPPTSAALQESCRKRAPTLILAERPRVPAPPGPSRPWGVQLAANFSQANVASIFGMLKQRHGKVIGDAEPMFVAERNLSRGRKPMVALRIGAETRDDALKLCQRLRANGGVCTVEKN